MCSDLGLTGEAIPLISHAVHEELLRHKKECLQTGLVNNTSHNDSRGPKRMLGVWRDLADAPSFGPRVDILTPDDIVGMEVEQERAHKSSPKISRRIVLS